MNIPIKTTASPKEQVRARRKAAIDSARASMFLEGFMASPEYETAAQQYIDGLIEISEFFQRTVALVEEQAERANR